MHSRMRFTSKLLFPLISALALLIAACGSGGTTGTATTVAHAKAPANKQVLVTTIASAAVPDFDTLDPAVVTDFNSGYAISTVFTGLVGLDDHSQIFGEEAQSWDKSADGLTYTFHLRPNLKFSDGTPLTAQDVAWSIDRALAPELKSPVAPYYLRYIKDSDKRNSGAVKTLIGDSLIVVDPNTLEIVLNKPIAFFLDTLTYPCSYTVEKSLIDKYGNTKWTDHLTEGGGDGPFKVKKYVHNVTFNVEPNPYYYGPKPQLQEIDMPFYKVQDTTYKDYLVNRLDDATVPLADFETARTRKDFFQFPILAINYYTMSYTKKPFDNIKIRQAFDLAINKDLIVSSIWKGSFIATNHIVPQGMYGYDPNLTGPDGVKGTAGDPTLAKQLFQQGLQEEGLTLSTLPQITLTYSSGGNQAVRNEVAAEQQMWQNVLGVTVKTDDIDLNTLFNDESEGANNPLMFYSGPAWLADYPDPEDWTTLQFDKGVAQNGMNFGQNNSSTAAQQQALQQQMEQADLMTDPNARLTAYNQIEQQLVNFVAWMPLEQQTAFGVRKPCVQGFFQNSLNDTPPTDWARVYISTDTPCANATVSP